jgi:hypothetical protein
LSDVGVPLEPFNLDAERSAQRESFGKKRHISAILEDDDDEDALDDDEWDAAQVARVQWSSVQKLDEAEHEAAQAEAEGNTAMRMRRSLLGVLDRMLGNESVVRTMKRLNRDSKAAFDAFAEAIDYLASQGLYDVYNMNKRQIQERYGRLLGKEDRQIGGSVVVVPEPERLYLLKWSDDGQPYGPFPESRMHAWNAQGYFSQPNMRPFAALWKSDSATVDLEVDMFAVADGTASADQSLPSHVDWRSVSEIFPPR